MYAYVRCFGTEGRRMDGHEYSGSEQIYECIIFQGSEVMELQFLSLPPAQIGFVPFVPNYLAGYIAQSSPSIPLPVQYPSGNAPFAGPSNFAELQNPSLQPVGTGSANLYPPTIHSSPGQFATPESVLYLPFGSSVNTDVNTIEGSGSKPLQSWYAEGAEDQNLKVAAKTASQPVPLPTKPKLGQDKQPWVSAALPSQSFQTAENDMKAAEASGSALRPSLAAKDAKEHSTKSAAKTAFGLPPRPQPGRGQQERGAAVLEGSSGHGRGSVAFGRGR